LNGTELVMEPADRAKELPLVLVISPAAPPVDHVLGMLFKWASVEHRIWMLNVVPGNAAPEVVSRLLAVAILDDEQQLMVPGFMPQRPATAMLLRNYAFRISRSRSLAPWAVLEMDRLARLLREQHETYLEAICAELRGEARTGFRPLPVGFIFTNSEGLARRAPNPPSLVVDLSRSEAESEGLEWWQIATRNYIRDRYMAHATAENIAQRTQDVVGNIHSINDKGLISFDASAASRYWLTLLGECDVEMGLRHGAGWRDTFMKDRAWVGSLTSAILEKNQRLQLPPACCLPFLVKYGKRQHMENALREGRLRISPASRYSDASLNSAIRDSELHARVELDPLFWPAATGFGPGERLGVTLSARSDYYVYCVSTSFSTRLLLDFEAECCLLIRDPSAFVARVRSAMATRLLGWHFRNADIQYYDPLGVSPAEVSICDWKHFRYAYQREHRLWWIPPSPRPQLPYVDIAIGSLADIAEIVEPTIFVQGGDG
jgi:hypothetical protein